MMVIFVIGARRSGGSARYRAPVDIGSGFNVLGVDSENIYAALKIRQFDRYAAVKASGTEQCGGRALFGVAFLLSTLCFLFCLA